MRLRKWVQAGWAAATNGYLPGFLTGTIYQGPLKQACVPGLNCYSCPGALGSCPIGAAQAVIGSRKFRFSYSVFGFLALMGALLGRLACGWLCPFGLFQELLNKIPFPKKVRAFRGDRALRLLKYAVLAVFVILLPLFFVRPGGASAPFFCQYVCPAGMLEGGLPLVAVNQPLRAAVGWLYAWKGFLLGAVVLLSVVIHRPFCKYLCPLGAIYALANPISLHRLHLNKSACVHCGKCSRACGMGVDPSVRPASTECVRCGDCVAVCPTGALRLGFPARQPHEKAKQPAEG
ncbi:MAG: 4Fe-4S binding protein [Clostridiales bacterium]|nr:4Fe-4S binding protein [Clostridiales bacterium]